MKKTISIILTIALVFSVGSICSFNLTANATTVNYDAGYVGLGDSIARAYGNYQGDGYVDMLGSLLKDKAHAKNAVVKFKNMAQDGDRTDNLLLKLKNSPEVINSLKNATLVTVSIGGNNIMQEMGRQVAVALGFDPTTDPAAESKAIEYLNAHKVTASATIVAHFNSTAFKNVMAQKVAEVRADIPQIVKEIRKQSQNCNLVFQTLFCPTQFVFLESFMNKYITDLNNVIKELAPQRYTVVDIYTAFENAPNQADLTFTNVMGGIFDPHPTKAGQKVIYDNMLPYMQTVINNLPTRTKTADYSSFGNLRQYTKYGFDFDSSAFVAGTSIFSSGNTAKNYIDVGGTATGNPAAYDLKIVNNSHIKGLEFNMYQNYNCTPIELKLNSAVCGTSFLSGTKTIPSNSLDHGVLMYVDTTQFTGQNTMLFQWQETDASGSATRRGLKGNGEAYKQDANGDFTQPVTINANEYLVLPQNYAGYIAIPFNSFKTIWGTNDINFAVDLKNVTSFSIYKGSDANGGKLMFDEFNFYGRTLTNDALVPAQGQTATQGTPQNLIPLFNFEDNMFIADQSIYNPNSYRLQIEKYLSGPTLKNPPQLNLDVIGYNGVPNSNSTKAMRFETLPAQASGGEFVGFSFNSRQELGIFEKITERGNLIASNSTSDGVAFYLDLTNYTSPAPFALNVIWHETDCDGNGLPILVQENGGMQVQQNTSRKLNAAYQNVEGVLDNGTSVSLQLSGDTVVVPNLPSGEKFKGWVKLPFASFMTCWNSSDANGAVDFYDIFGFNLYYSSYPSRTGQFVLDEFSFYGPNFANIKSQIDTYVPDAGLLDVNFNSNGTLSDQTGCSTLTKNGGVTVGDINVTHKGTSYTVPGMTVSAAGQNVIANYGSFMGTPALEKYYYENGFTVEAFGVNRSPSGEQAYISTCQSGGWGLFGQSPGAKFITNTAGSYKTASINTALSTTELVHLVGVYDFINKKVSLYKDGLLVSKADITGEFTPGGGEAFNKICLGADVDTYGAGSQSQMTNFSLVEAKVYSEPLNGNQIKIVYNNAVASLAN